MALKTRGQAQAICLPRMSGRSSVATADAVTGNSPRAPQNETGPWNQLLFNATYGRHATLACTPRTIKSIQGAQALRKDAISGHARMKATIKGLKATFSCQFCKESLEASDTDNHGSEPAAQPGAQPPLSDPRRSRGVIDWMRKRSASAPLTFTAPDARTEGSHSSKQSFPAGLNPGSAEFVHALTTDQQLRAPKDGERLQSRQEALRDTGSTLQVVPSRHVRFATPAEAPRVMQHDLKGPDGRRSERPAGIASAGLANLPSGELPAASESTGKHAAEATRGEQRFATGSAPSMSGEHEAHGASSEDVVVYVPKSVPHRQPSAQNTSPGPRRCR